MAKDKPRIFDFDKGDTLIILKTADAFNRIGFDIIYRWVELRKSGNLDPFEKIELAVAATNILLSIELYLKGVRLALTGDYQNSHPLLWHYNNLPKATRTTIRDRFDILKQDPKKNEFPLSIVLSIIDRGEPPYDPCNPELTIEEFLSAHSEGFVEWRYHFDDRTGYNKYADFAMMLCMTEALKWFIDNQVLPRLEQNS